MINKILLEKMNKYEKVNESELYIRKFDLKDMSLRKIRDFLFGEGVIVEEDLTNQCYIAYFKLGMLRINRTLVGFIIDNNQLIICGYTRKNFMGKRDNKKTIEYIVSKLVLNKNNHKTKYLRIIVIVCAILLLGFEFIFVRPAVNCTRQYNQAVEQFNQKSKDYNKKIKGVSTENIEGVPGKVHTLKKENVDFLSVSLSVFKGNSVAKIKNDQKTIHKMIKTMDNAEQIISQIDNPKATWIEERLKNIKEIKSIQHVSKNHDPNGLLNKNHGYTTCVYFTVDGVKIEDESQNPIDLGTDGGGCVEVYSNLKDAKNRCEYLKQFDDTYLYTGSYALIGTMVVRTTYVLNNEQQYVLTDKIFKELADIK